MGEKEAGEKEKKSKSWEDKKEFGESSYPVEQRESVSKVFCAIYRIQGYTFLLV